MFLNLLKKKICPIGIDPGSGYIKMSQLRREDNGLVLNAAAISEMPKDIAAGSADWQRWIAETSANLIANNKFIGREVIASIPSEDIFIDQFQISRVPESQLNEAITSKLAKKLPFNIKDAIIKHVCNDNKSNGHFDVLVMVTERQKIDRNLAIYEKAGLTIKGMCVWCVAGVNVYTNFFGRRQTDKDAVVLLLEMGVRHTNVMICKHNNLLFARRITIGYEQLMQGHGAERLVSEIDACCRYYESLNNSDKIERLILFSDKNVNRKICEKIADFAQMKQMPAQIGDVMAAVNVQSARLNDIDRRGPQPNWAMSFGLSLEGLKGR
jgi:Tfp pilus assembly PilM family ATPase